MLHWLCVDVLILIQKTTFFSKLNGKKYPSLPWLDTRTSINTGGVKTFDGPKPSLFKTFNMMLYYSICYLSTILKLFRQCGIFVLFFILFYTYKAVNIYFNNNIIQCISYGEYIMAVIQNRHTILWTYRCSCRIKD